MYICHPVIESTAAYKEIYRTLEVQPIHLTHVQVRSLTRNRLVGRVYLGLWPSSYPYILERALNEYRINTSVIIYLLFPFHDLYILSMK